MSILDGELHQSLIEKQHQPELVHIRNNDKDAIREYWVSDGFYCWLAAYASHEGMISQEIIQTADREMFYRIKERYAQEGAGRIQ